MTSNERIGKNINRRRFLSLAAASVTGIALPPKEAVGRELSRIAADSEEYESGSSETELARPFVDDLNESFRSVDQGLTIDKYPNQVKERVRKYLDDFASSLEISAEQRTYALDSEALLYAVKEMKSGKDLDQRIVDMLTTLFENAIHNAARDSIGNIPPPQADRRNGEHTI